MENETHAGTLDDDVTAKSFTPDIRDLLGMPAAEPAGEKRRA